MQAVRWRRLLAEATQHEGHLRLQISGPAAVLDQKTAYGMQFALFLPALCAARRWHAVAQVVPPRGHLALRLELSDELHLPGMAQSAEHVPAELTAWMRQVAAKLTAWRPVEPEPILIPGGEVVFPDWAALPEPGEVGRVSVELFHRWHRNALERRLRQVRAGQLPRFLVGVDRSLAKQDGIEAQLDHPAVFRFSELPTPGILAKALAALA
jgi:predicted nuclease of restriction endonuclease-like RecB superfamily